MQVSLRKDTFMVLVDPARLFLLTTTLHWAPIPCGGVDHRDVATIKSGALLGITTKVDAYDFMFLGACVLAER
jgi:hypothetical protein